MSDWVASEATWSLSDSQCSALVSPWHNSFYYDNIDSIEEETSSVLKSGFEPLDDTSQDNVFKKSGGLNKESKIIKQDHFTMEKIIELV